MLEDIYLFDVMVMLVVVVDYYMGVLEGEEMFKDLKVILGIVMGNFVVSDLRYVRKFNICFQVGIILFF